MSDQKEKPSTLASGDMSDPPHICIIGAGISGLRAADVLLQKGYKVTILEARDRIGGRICQSDKLGYTVDIGPNWIASCFLSTSLHATGDKHPIRDLAIETNTSLHHWNNKQNIFTSDGKLLPAEKSAELSTLLWDIIEEAFAYSAKNGKSIPETASLYDFIESTVKEKLPDRLEDQKLILSMSEMWGAYVGHPVTRQSLRFSWMEECCGGDETFIETTYEAILDRIAKLPREKADIRLGSRVMKVVTPTDRFSGAIKVATMKAEVVECDEIICTVPLGCLQEVKERGFYPRLPQKICDAMDNISIGRLEKVYITFPSAFWTVNQEDNFAGYTNWLSPKYAPDTNPECWPQEIWNLAAFSPENRRPTLLFYLYGDCSRHIVKLTFDRSTEERHAALDAFFRPYYSLLPNFSADDENCKPKAILSTEWQMDDLAGYGSYCNFQVGIKDADEDVKTIRHGVPERRLWFAGEHTAPFEELGTAAGAYMSGEAVALRIFDEYLAEKERY
ncbi:hypothetical protein VE01_01249 [Pseudogymnoascus verrucosus]|uniref:Amine oxidase domain-containing protein n=1 Tax=Pseudogymnoascus verrucosus TaxID=342668 RepID=A0A1B8GXT5_9PEZI|nr:uncharacterized protein VE01_01249 [Pseudogymnoascus verrucosus]OBU00636.1 hypothetical protein VE01_01249 [Pseudogymnoascus verrucosus]